MPDSEPVSPSDARRNCAVTAAASLATVVCALCAACAPGERESHLVARRPLEAQPGDARIVLFLDASPNAPGRAEVVALDAGLPPDP